MFRALLRLIVIVLVLGVAIAFFMGYRFGGGPAETVDRPVGTTGVDTSRARETGARVGEAVADGANEAGRALSTASLGAKIKSKMALDDTVRARDIDVDVAEGGVVTLSGSVSSQAERTKAVQLARETAGVTSVIDRMSVK